MLLLAVTAYLVLQQPGTGTVGPAPAVPTATTGDRGADTAALLRDLEQALRDGDVAAARALAPGDQPRAQRRAAALARNVRRLEVTGIRLRPEAEAPAPPDLARRFGAGTWVSAARVGWRYAGADKRPVASAAVLVLTPQADGGAALVDTRPATTARTPLWMLQPLAVRRRDRVLVATADEATADPLLRHAAAAARVVERRVPGWRGELVVEAPGTAAAFRGASGSSAAAVRSIAAVTTTADGSTLPGSPERVYLNPRVFGSLGPAGQQVVLRHEGTHVAVRAAVSRLPVWLSEGFADWVALADSRVPVRVLASQARALVRDRGAPRRLPGRTDFAATNPDLGAAYESAWLAARLIATTYGEADLLRFLRVAEREGSVGPAFRTVLGTTRVGFTREWRRELARLAR